MKKIITLLLSTSLLLTVASCGTPSELKTLRNETNKIKQQMSISPSPRPLSLRQELLDELQDEYAILKARMPQITTETYGDASNTMDALMENYEEQTEIIEGINNEEDLELLTDKVAELNEKYEAYLSDGKKKQAQEVEKHINLILYGNEQGEKNW